MTRFIELTARGQAGSGKTVLLAWIVDQLSHIGVSGAYIKNPDEHRVLLEISDEQIPLLVGLKSSTYGKRMTLTDEEFKLIDDHRLSKLY